jgi:hypothetical protein
MVGINLGTLHFRSLGYSNLFSHPEYFVPEIPDHAPPAHLKSTTLVHFKTSAFRRPSRSLLPGMLSPRVHDLLTRTSHRSMATSLFGYSGFGIFNSPPLVSPGVLPPMSTSFQSVRPLNFLISHDVFSTIDDFDLLQPSGVCHTPRPEPFEVTFPEVSDMSTCISWKPMAWIYFNLRLFGNFRFSLSTKLLKCSRS